MARKLPDTGDASTTLTDRTTTDATIQLQGVATTSRRWLRWTVGIGR